MGLDINPDFYCTELSINNEVMRKRLRIKKKRKNNGYRFFAMAQRRRRFKITS